MWIKVVGVNKEEVISRDRHKDMHNDQKRNKGKERIKDDFGIFIVRKNEKKSVSHSVLSDSLWPYGL